MRIQFPGLFDLQVNGFGGVDFNAPDLTRDRVSGALERIRTTGVTRLLPTLITSSFGDFAAAARAIASIADPAIAGIHMEGPYISPDDGPRGAHPKAHVRPASADDFERRQDAADGRIVLVTLAPEVPGALALIERLVSTGVRVAIGHSSATTRQIADAIAAGATLSTHLGNGCASVLPRHPNVIWEQLAADTLHASLIVDGHHLPPATVKAMVRAKGSGSDDSRDRFDRRRGLRARTVRDRRCRMRAWRRRSRLPAGHAVSRGVQPDVGPGHRQHGALHRAAD